MKSLDGAVTVLEPVQWLTGETVPDAVVIAVKPFDVAAALSRSLKTGARRSHRRSGFQSSQGKVSLFCEDCFPKRRKRRRVFCRVMPNTPALIDEAISAYTLSENATEKDAAMAEKIFHACGKTVAVPEKFMNAITGLSGTGPLTFFSFLNR